MPKSTLSFKSSQSPTPTTQYSDDPRLAAFEYAREPGVPTVVRMLCAFAAFEGGLGDGTVLDVGGSWADGLELLLADEYPDLDVRATLREHLSGVCRVIFDIDELYPPKPSRSPSQATKDYPRKPISTTSALAVFAKDQYRCVHCGSQADLTVDHIVPVIRGGTNEDDNLQTLCRSCNSSKGAT